MGGAAVVALGSGNRVLHRDMDAALTANNHLRRSGLDCGLPITPRGVAPGAPPPGKNKDHQEGQQKPHGVRPRMISITKREPT